MALQSANFLLFCNSCWSYSSKRASTTEDLEFCPPYTAP